MSNVQKNKDMIMSSIDKAVFKSTDDKAILQLKYDQLNFKNNFVQISVIVMSTLITFVETIKAAYEINEYASMLLPIMIATYIALVTAITRFLKYDENRENISKIIERFSFIINKYKKTKHDIKYFDYNDSNKEQWENMLFIYHTETYDYYNQTREMFDNAMTFKEKVYYRDKLKLLHIDAMFNDRDHQNIAKNRDSQHRQHLYDKSFLSGCCKRKRKDYQNILDQFDENGELIRSEPILINRDDSLNSDTFVSHNVSEAISAVTSEATTEATSKASAEVTEATEAASKAAEAISAEVTEATTEAASKAVSKVSEAASEVSEAISAATSEVSKVSETSAAIEETEKLNINSVSVV